MGSDPAFVMSGVRLNRPWGKKLTARGRGEWVEQHPAEQPHSREKEKESGMVARERHGSGPDGQKKYICCYVRGIKL